MNTRGVVKIETLDNVKNTYLLLESCEILIRL